MISKKYSGLSILLILALLFSVAAALVPAAPAQASPPSAISISLVYGNGNTSNTGPACVLPSGTVYVNFTFTDNTTEYCAVFMQQGSTIINGQTNTLSAGANQLLIYPGSATTGYWNVYVLVGGIQSPLASNAVYVETSSTLPVVSVSTPNLCWKPGSSQTIYWSGTIPSVSSENFSSVTITWSGNTLRSLTNVAQGAYSFQYTPVPSSGSSPLYITAISNAGNTGTAYYPTGGGIIQVLTAGTITPSIPTLPSSSYSGGAVTTISFSAIGATTTNFTYLLSLNKGNGTSENITPGWYTPTGTSVVYNWTVPNDVISSSCYVQVWIQDCAGNISAPVSSTTFSIACINCGPSVIITSPVSGITWIPGTTENITWTVNDPLSAATHTCVVTYSTNDNATWPWSPAAIIASGNTGTSYWATWSIPSNITTSYNSEICVQAISPTGNSGTGISGLFNIYQFTQAPTVSVYSPAAGASWQAGTTQYIGWSATGQLSSTPMDYRIYYVPNGGSLTLITTLYRQTQSSTNTYAWTIPTSLTSGAYTIQVVAAYWVGPPAQEQFPTQANSQTFNITPPTTPCTSYSVPISLTTGWNLISLPLIPQSTDPGTLLSGVLPSVSAVWYYSPTGANTGTWQSYIPGTSSTLTRMADGYSYWILMTAPATLTVTGYKCPCSSGGGPPTPASPYYWPYSGWQMIGVKSTIPISITNYLQGSCGATYSIPIYYFNTGTQSLATISDCTANMTPGLGYWIYVPSQLGLVPPCQYAIVEIRYNGCGCNRTRLQPQFQRSNLEM